MVNDVEICYSTDPMVNVKMDFNKCNEYLLDIILIDPMTEEIQAQIDELRRKIIKYGVRSIFESFYELHIFFYVILVLCFLYVLIN